MPARWGRLRRPLALSVQGGRLGQGELVLPDTVESRWLAADRAEELSAARARLLAALDQGGRDRAPGPAADAQVAFDCWLQQAVWSADADLSCKQRFETAIAEVERALTTEGGVYLVFFAWDQADLTLSPRRCWRRSRPTMRAVGRRGSPSPDTPIAPGTEAYNQGLSEQRAQNVARALVARGVPESALDVQWFGETRPRVPTADGVREPQNRRVEIVFGDGPSA